MHIQHEHQENEGRFFIASEGNSNSDVAEMDYRIATDGRMVIEHTEVDEALQGRNIGYELVHTAVDYAREHHIKITPLCSFAKAVFDKNKDFTNVLA